MHVANGNRNIANSKVAAHNCRTKRFARIGSAGVINTDLTIYVRFMKTKYGCMSMRHLSLQTRTELFNLVFTLLVKVRHLRKGKFFNFNRYIAQSISIETHKIVSK